MARVGSQYEACPSPGNQVKALIFSPDSAHVSQKQTQAQPIRKKKKALSFVFNYVEQRWVFNDVNTKA